jgi:hypothetical protein
MAKHDETDDDPVAELLRVLEGGEGSARMKELAWALGQSERRRETGQPDTAEAREWLAANEHPHPIALNYFQTRAASEQFVESLYAAGATRVLVDNISYDDAEGPHSDCMVVELPDAPEARTRILTLCQANCHEDGSDFTDKGQGSVSLWWD